MKLAVGTAMWTWDWGLRAGGGWALSMEMPGTRAAPGEAMEAACPSLPDPGGSACETSSQGRPTQVWGAAACAP